MAGAKVYVVRHARTALNAGGETSVDRIRGWINEPLSAEGKKEAARLGEELKDLEIDCLICSDLQRSQQTAQVIGKRHYLKPQPTKGLRPWDLGVLSGKPSKEAAPVIQHFAREAPGQRVPEGESFKDFTGRLFSCLEKILAGAKESGKTVCVISHFRDVKAIQAWLKGGQDVNNLDLETFSKDDLDPGAILLLEPDGKGWKGQLISKGMT